MSEPRLKGIAPLLLIALLLMGTIGLSGYVTIAVFGWSAPVAGVSIAVCNLILAKTLTSRYLTYQPGESAGQPAPAQHRLHGAAAAACPHLRGVADMMRGHGVALAAPPGGQGISADCRLDFEELNRRMRLDGCVVYSEQLDDRGTGAWLYCRACGFTMQLRHPETGGAVFPAAV